MEKSGYQTKRDKFLGRLDKYNNIKDPGLDSVRFISTTWSAYKVNEDLRKYLDDNDRIVITALLKGNYAGWLNIDVWEWVEKRL
jgi:hypothetical protein